MVALLIANEHYLRTVLGLIEAKPEEIDQRQNELDDFVLQHPNYRVPKQFLDHFIISYSKEAPDERNEQCNELYPSP